MAELVVGLVAGLVRQLGMQLKLEDRLTSGRNLQLGNLAARWIKVFSNR